MQRESNAAESTGQDGFSHLDRALVEAAQEMSFDWPDFVPVEQIIPGMPEVALSSLLILGLAALGGLYFLFFAQ